MWGPRPKTDRRNISGREADQCCERNVNNVRGRRGAQKGRPRPSPRSPRPAAAARCPPPELRSASAGGGAGDAPGAAARARCGAALALSWAGGAASRLPPSGEPGAQHEGRGVGTGKKEAKPKATQRRPSERRSRPDRVSLGPPSRGGTRQPAAGATESHRSAAPHEARPCVSRLIPGVSCHFPRFTDVTYPWTGQRICPHLSPVKRLFRRGEVRSRQAPSLTRGRNILGGRKHRVWRVWATRHHGDPAR